MNKKLIVALAATATFVAGFSWFMTKSHKDTMEREPFLSMFESGEIQREQFKKAYNMMFKDALMGRLDANDMTTEELDDTLITKYLPLV